MTRSPFDGSEPIAAGRRPGGRWCAAAGLIAVVFAYLGLVFATPLPAQRATAPDGVSAVDAAGRGAHLLPRERGRAVAAARTLDPPPADRPSGATALDPAFPGLPIATRGAAVTVATAAAIPAAPRAFLARGPPRGAV